MDEYCCDLLFSIGASSIRIWEAEICEFENLPEEDKSTLHHGRIALKSLQLRPKLKVFLPEQILDHNLVAALDDRICLSRSNNSLVVFEIKSDSANPSSRKTSHDYNKEMKNQRKNVKGSNFQVIIRMHRNLVNF